MTVSSSKARVCVVLGKSSGIGGATTALVSERGYRVVVIGRDAEKLRKAQRLRAKLAIPETSAFSDISSLGRIIDAAHITTLVHSSYDCPRIVGQAINIDCDMTAGVSSVLWQRADQEY